MELITKDNKQKYQRQVEINSIIDFVRNNQQMSNSNFQEVVKRLESIKKETK